MVCKRNKIVITSYIISASVRPFLEKSGPNSAAVLSGQSLFYSTLFAVMRPEFSVSWQHCSRPLTFLFIHSSTRHYRNYHSQSALVKAETKRTPYSRWREKPHLKKNRRRHKAFVSLYDKCLQYDSMYSTFTWKQLYCKVL